MRGAIGPPADGWHTLSGIRFQRPTRLSLSDMSTAVPNAGPAAPRSIVASPSNGILDRLASAHPFDEIKIGLSRRWPRRGASWRSTFGPGERRPAGWRARSGPWADTNSHENFTEWALLIRDKGPEDRCKKRISVLRHSTGQLISRTILPITSPRSLRSCARAASRNGKRRPTVWISRLLFSSAASSARQALRSAALRS